MSDCNFIASLDHLFTCMIVYDLNSQEFGVWFRSEVNPHSLVVMHVGNNFAVGKMTCVVNCNALNVDK